MSSRPSLGRGGWHGTCGATPDHNEAQQFLAVGLQRARQRSQLKTLPNPPPQPNSIIDLLRKLLALSVNLCCILTSTCCGVILFGEEDKTIACFLDEVECGEHLQKVAVLRHPWDTKSSSLLAH